MQQWELLTKIYLIKKPDDNQILQEYENNSCWWHYFQDAVYALTGAVFYVAAGGAFLDAVNNDAGNGLGAMCIITGAVFVVDTAFALISLKKDLW